MALLTPGGLRSDDPLSIKGTCPENIERVRAAVGKSDKLALLDQREVKQNFLYRSTWVTRK
jgi:hypothetical protein